MSKKFIKIDSTDYIEQDLDDVIYECKAIPVGEFSNIEVLKRLDWLVDASSQTFEQFENTRKLLIEFEGDFYRLYGSSLDTELEDEFDNYMDMLAEVQSYENELEKLSFNIEKPIKPYEFVHKFFEYLPSHFDEFEPITFLKPLVEALGFTYVKRGLVTDDGYMDYIYVDNNITDEFEDYMRGFNYIDVSIFNEFGECEDVYSSIWLPYGHNINEVMESIGYERDDYYLVKNEYLDDICYYIDVKDYNWCESNTCYKFFNYHDAVKGV